MIIFELSLVQNFSCKFFNFSYEDREDIRDRSTRVLYFHDKPGATLRLRIIAETATPSTAIR